MTDLETLVATMDQTIAHAAAQNLIPTTGFVVFEFDSGERYEGTIVDLKLHGVGALRHADGSIYKGDFVAGLKRGYGMTVFTNGDKHVGKYEGNMFHGSGTFLSGDGTFKYFGEFEFGECHGSGTITYQNGVKFFGTFSNGQRLDGDYIYPSGKVRSSERCSDSFDDSSPGSPVSSMDDQSISSLSSSPADTSGSESE